MTTTYYPAKGLIGGVADDLDFHDGAILNDDDIGIVSVSDNVYIYRLEATSGAAESSPDVISPDSNAGNKRWLLQSIQAATMQAATGGFGIARTDGTLHVQTASAGAVTARAEANDVVVENNASGGISILGPDAENLNFYFGSPADNLGALIRWNYDSGIFTLGASKAGGQVAILTDAGTEAMRIDASQNVGLGVTAFGTNATNVLGIKADGTVPGSSPAGMIQIFADDSSAGATNATLAIRTEEAVVGEVLACDSTLNIWVNGTEYHLLMRAVV